MFVMEIEALTVDEWREKLGLDSDKELADYFGVTDNSISYYRRTGVRIVKEGNEFKRLSNLRRR